MTAMFAAGRAAGRGCCHQHPLPHECLRKQSKSEGTTRVCSTRARHTKSLDARGARATFLTHARASTGRRRGTGAGKAGPAAHLHEARAQLVAAAGGAWRRQGVPPLAVAQPSVAAHAARVAAAADGVRILNQAQTAPTSEPAFRVNLSRERGNTHGFLISSPGSTRFPARSQILARFGLDSRSHFKQSRRHPGGHAGARGPDSVLTSCIVVCPLRGRTITVVRANTIL